MSDIRDRLNEFVRDHGDFTIAVLALTILALCAVTWLWGRQTKHLRRLLAQERAANRAVLPAPSEAVMAVVASETAIRERDQAPEAGNREIERSGRAMYSVAQRPEEAAEPAAPPARDSLGWTLPAGADGAAAVPANVPAPSESPRGTQPDWAEPPPTGSTERESATAPGPAPWVSPSSLTTELTTVHAEPEPTTGHLEPEATETGTEPEAAAAVASPATPNPEPHSAYVAWNAVTSGPHAGNGNGASHAVPPEAGGEAPEQERAGFTPWSVTSERIATPSPLSPGPPPGSWAPATVSDSLAEPEAGPPAWYRPPVFVPEPPASDDPVPVPDPPVGAWAPPTQAPTPPLPADGTGASSAADGTETSSAIDVLLVEDDDNVSKVYRLLLESKGYGVRIASDGVAGLDEARLRRPDLVLLDVMMPRMNGILFLQALRMESALESVPVVILSNFKEPRLVERALALGALDYMVKAQTRPEALLNALPHWLRRERAFAG